MQLHHFSASYLSPLCVCSAELLITALLCSYYTLSPFSTPRFQMCRAARRCNTTLVRLIGPYSTKRTKSGMCFAANTTHKRTSKYGWVQRSAEQWWRFPHVLFIFDTSWVWQARVQLCVLSLSWMNEADDALIPNRRHSIAMQHSHDTDLRPLRQQNTMQVNSEGTNSPKLV